MMDGEKCGHFFDRAKTLLPDAQELTLSGILGYKHLRIIIAKEIGWLCISLGRSLY